LRRACRNKNKRAYFRAHKAYKQAQKVSENVKNSALQEKLERDLTNDFWGTSRKILQNTYNNENVKPQFSIDEANKYYKNTYEIKKLANIEKIKTWLPECSSPHKNFNMSPILSEEIEAVLKEKLKNKSPGEDGITYDILKYIPSAYPYLCIIYNHILFNDHKAYDDWAKCVFKLFHKPGKEDLKKFNSWRMIALSSVIGKIFHTIIGRRMALFLTQNNYIDSTVQKMYLKDISGCTEHSFTMLEVIKNARAIQNTVHITNLDLADAFGSVPHNLIEFAMEYYSIPIPVREYMMNLYSKLQGKVSVNGILTDTFNFLTGTFQGDPGSAIIFILVYNLLYEGIKHEKELWAYRFNKDGDIKCFLQLIADDFTLFTRHARAHQRILNRIYEMMNDMNLRVNPSKSVTISLPCGLFQIVPFQFGEGIENKIPSIYEVDKVNTLGMVIPNQTKKNTSHNNHIYDLVIDKLQNVANSQIGPLFKLKIIFKCFMPSIMYFLQVHQTSKTLLETLDRELVGFVKSTLNLPRSLTPDAIFHKKGLGLCSFTYFNCISKAYCVVQMINSLDKHINKLIDYKYNRENKFSQQTMFCEIRDLVEQEKPKLQQNNNNGSQNKTSIETWKANCRKRIDNDIQVKLSENFGKKQLQGKQLIELEDLDVDLMQHVLFDIPPHLAKFALSSRFNCIPVATNIVRWKIGNHDRCFLCKTQPETTLHCLNGCLVARHDRYRWRHDSILNHIIKVISDNRNLQIFADLDNYRENNSRGTIPPSWLLDWQERNNFSANDETVIDITSQFFYKPDLVIGSYNGKVTILELTVPFENNIEKQHFEKIKRYHKLCSEILPTCKEIISVKFFALEIGSRGIWTKRNKITLRNFLKEVGKYISPKNLKKLYCDLAQMSIQASYYIFSQRKNTMWPYPELIQYRYHYF